MRPRALKVTDTEEAVADIVEAITYLNERNPTAAANLDAEIAQCIERLVPWKRIVLQKYPRDDLVAYGHNRTS